MNPTKEDIKVIEPFNQIKTKGVYIDIRCSST